MSRQPKKEENIRQKIAIIISYTDEQGNLHVALVHKGTESKRDIWRFPEGQVKEAESLSEAASRVVKEQLGKTTADLGTLNQVGEPDKVETTIPFFRQHYVFSLGHHITDKEAQEKLDSLKPKSVFKSGELCFVKANDLPKTGLYYFNDIPRKARLSSLNTIRKLNTEHQEQKAGTVSDQREPKRQENSERENNKTMRKEEYPIATLPADILFIIVQFLSFQGLLAFLKSSKLIRKSLESVTFWMQVSLADLVSLSNPPKFLQTCLSDPDFWEKKFAQGGLDLEVGLEHLMLIPNLPSFMHVALLNLSRKSFDSRFLRCQNNDERRAIFMRGNYLYSQYLKKGIYSKALYFSRFVSQRDIKSLHLPLVLLAIHYDSRNSTLHYQSDLDYIYQHEIKWIYEMRKKLITLRLNNKVQESDYEREQWKSLHLEFTLLFAAFLNQENVLLELLKSPKAVSLINHPIRGGITPHMIMRFCCGKSVTNLLPRMPKVSMTIANLKEMVEWGRSTLSIALLQPGAKACLNQVVDDDRNTLLHLAAARPDRGINIKPLIEAGAGVHKLNQRGQSPLHIALNQGISIVDLQHLVFIKPGLDKQEPVDGVESTVHDQTSLTEFFNNIVHYTAKDCDKLAKLIFSKVYLTHEQEESAWNYEKLATFCKAVFSECRAKNTKVIPLFVAIFKVLSDQHTYVEKSSRPFFLDLYQAALICPTATAYLTDSDAFLLKFLRYAERIPVVGDTGKKEFSVRLFNMDKFKAIHIEGRRILNKVHHLVLFSNLTDGLMQTLRRELDNAKSYYSKGMK